MQAISTGKCDGIFQLESSGMKSFMKELKPGNIEDLIAGISLYRPGPMDFIPQYIKGKNNPDGVTYDCPQLEPILKPTYGLYSISGTGNADSKRSCRILMGTK